MPKTAKNESDAETVPTMLNEEQVLEELLVFWDAYSPLSLSAVRDACLKKNTLDAIGLDSDEAQACVNKYNSIILRKPGKGPIVPPSLAKSWANEKMSEIVKAVTERAQP